MDSFPQNPSLPYSYSEYLHQLFEQERDLYYRWKKGGEQSIREYIAHHGLNFKKLDNLNQYKPLSLGDLDQTPKDDSIEIPF